MHKFRPLNMVELPKDISACHALIRSLEAQLGQQSAQIAELLEKIAELESRLNKNSSNSHKPPSSDGLKKKPKVKPAFSRKKGKKSGGQPGHQGKTLEMVSLADKTNHLLPSHCNCGQSLADAQAKLLETRQVFDLPEPKLEVTEYQQLACHCPACGAYHQGEFPAGVSAAVQYGPGVHALVVMLNVALKLPINKVRRLFEDLYGYAINDNTIIKATRKCYERLANSEKALKSRLLEALVVHFDETGVRVAGKLHWLHTACTKAYTYLFVHPHRGKKALKDSASILPDFSHWAIHDCWASYFNFGQCLHAICGAHILRELEALREKEVQWASWFQRYLLALYRLSDQGKGQLSPAQEQKAMRLFDNIWTYADQIEPQPEKQKGKRGRPKATKGRNLLNRFKTHQSALLAFAFHQEVPFTNNQAERDLRPAKTKQKVSGGFRTLEGANIFARIHGFVSTIRKHQRNVFREIRAVFEGTPFLAKQGET
ncbi:MAG: IS66 family transposase [Bacteroidota bacterium]